MTTETRLSPLPREKVSHIQDVMINGCLAFRLGGDYKTLFRRARNRALGVQRKAFDQLLEADDAGMERLEAILLDL